MDAFTVIRGRLLAADPDLAAEAVVADARLTDLIPDSMTRLDVITDVLEDMGIAGPLRDFAVAGTVGQLSWLVDRRAEA